MQEAFSIMHVCFSQLEDHGVVEVVKFFAVTYPCVPEDSTSVCIISFTIVVLRMFGMRHWRQRVGCHPGIVCYHED